MIKYVDYEAYHQSERLPVKRQGLFAVLLGCVVSRRMGPVEVLGKEPQAVRVETVKGLRQVAEESNNTPVVYLVEEETGTEIELRRFTG